MRFAPTAEQQDLRIAVRELMRDRCPSSVVRAEPDDPAINGLAEEICRMGALGLLVAERDGGLGLDENYLVPLMVETGWAAAPLPLVDSIAFAPGLLSHAGYSDGPDYRKRWCVADPAKRAETRFGQPAGLLLRGGFGGTGAVQLVDLDTAVRSHLAAMDPSADVHDVRGGQELAIVDDPVLVRQAWQRGVLAAAAQLIGLARHMLEMTVDYVAGRTQFGVPVGSFQAVKHRLATALLAVEFAAPVVDRAGHSMASANPGADRDVSSAKALASEAARAVGREAIQCHGAMGYTTEYDLQLYLKRAWALAADWGSASWHRARLAGHLGMSLTGSTPAG
ncbi:hypothetical protein EV191_11520 [Tamaricihabitans halophyticus]|uniref:Alkylation response protein AidB-like acyl-CoA dehydrogenase n=1 Tax=Tamaricihabitans halophyticus TaxID=1262583 RepID=A0A4R2Q9Z4_9PSEU|nr:acyl-CoA dehydrogenase [Tamaricihabitans halophyticus]TCP45740.1 hypothetical protein EV191_11520 [Tamaricihabitans halophyticus]